jgi:hypothetical protein
LELERLRQHLNRLRVTGANATTTSTAQLGVYNDSSQTRMALSANQTTNTVNFISGGSLINPDFVWSTGDSTAVELMRITRTGNVGIGTASPTSKLHLYKTGTSDNILNIQNGQDAYASILALTANNDGGAIYNSLQSSTNGGTQHFKIWGGGAVSTMAFNTGGTEAMRIDSSGRLLVGTTNTNPHLFTSGRGFAINQGTFGIDAACDNIVGIFNRTDADGTIVEFKKAGTKVGSIGTSSGYTKITSGDGTNGSGLQFGDSKIYPVA